MEREVGGGIGMGNTCKPMAVSFKCMTKSTTNKKKKRFVSHLGHYRVLCRVPYAILAFIVRRIVMIPRLFKNSGNREIIPGEKIFQFWTTVILS